MKAEEKKQFRASIRAEIARLSDGYIAESNAGIAQRVLSLEAYRRADRVFAYCSQARECSTRAIIDDAVRQGKTVALPVVQGAGQMVFARVCGKLSAGAFGIDEPQGDIDVLTPTKRDIMIVPAMCCDEEGYRLGRGGGYYDRYLADCPAYSVCLCRAALLVQKVPRDWNDLPVECVITENERIPCSEKRVK